MSMQWGGDKANNLRSKVRSDEATITIKRGSPVFYAMDGTRDGYDVVSSEAIAAASQTLIAGIACTEIAPGKIRESFVHGLCSFVRVITTTRAASTDVWVSYSAGALGDVLSINSASGAQAVSRVGAGSAGILNHLALAQTYASATTQASSLGGTSLSSISEMKVFIRQL